MARPINCLIGLSLGTIFFAGRKSMFEEKEIHKERAKTRLVSSTQVENLPAAEFCNLLERSSLSELESILNSLNESERQKSHKRKKDGRSLASVILWWELRRPVFNLIVGLCGLLTLIALSIVNHAPGYYLLIGTITYFVVLNLSYTTVWMIDLVVHYFSRGKGAKFREKLFQQGTVFSVMVTLALTVLLPVTLLFVAPWG